MKDHLFKIFILLFIGSGITLTSCSPTKTFYFYTTINSLDESITRDSSGLLIHKSDSLDLYYSVINRGMNINISIKNKTSSPLYIDWEKSTIKANGYLARSITSLAQMTLKNVEQYSQIEPNTAKTYQLLSAHFDISQINTRGSKKQNTYITDKKIKTSSIDFTPQSSPLSITSNLYIKANQKDTIISNTFFVLKISRINKKAYNALSNSSIAPKDGFCSLYEVDRGKENIIGNILFSLLFGAALNTVTKDGIYIPSESDRNKIYNPYTDPE